MVDRQEASSQMKIYSPSGHAAPKDWQRFLIHPLRTFWGDGSDRWEEYAHAFAFYRELFQPVDTIDTSDAVFLPLSINYYYRQHKMHLVRKTCRAAAEHGKIVYIWIEGDFDIRHHIPGAVYLKNASFKSKGYKNEIIRPGDVREDLLQKYSAGRLLLRTKSARPVIGFDGLASYPPLRLSGLIAQNMLLNLKFWLGISSFLPPPVLPLLLRRNWILNYLEGAEGITSQFYRRSAFATGTLGKDEEARAAFIRNICDSDYTLCIRGAANYSLRFYETLCLGRIPLFINTDCVLPFESDIDYKRITLWVESKNLQYLPEIVMDFHQSLHEDDFRQKQLDCRKVWETYFTPEGFYRQLVSRKFKV